MAKSKNREPSPILVLRDVHGKDHEISFTPNALASMEEVLGVPVTALSERNTGFIALRAMVWAGLWGAVERREGDRAGAPCTLREAGTILDALQRTPMGFAGVLKKLARQLEISLPGVADSTDDAGEPAPPKA